MKAIIKKVLGVILIIVGLFALFTPLTPGSWLALIGLELLGVHLLIFKKFLNDKHRAALERFMKKFGLESSAKRGDDKSDTKEK
jgi:protein-S-isoprenylcysteine O-methyltransferase Ste14